MSLVFEAHRRRFTIKTTPMAPLSSAVKEVLAQLHLADVAPSQCRLLLKGKPVDMETPVRFANVGANKLELITGRELQLGVQAAAPAAAPAVAPGAVAPPAQEQAAPAPAPVSAPVAHPPHRAVAPPAQQQQQQQQARQAPGIGAAAPAEQPEAAGPSGDAPPSVRVFGQEVYVFTREAELEADTAAAGAGGGAGAEDDAFFEFTEGDLARVMASYASQRTREQGAHLATRAMREREEEARAASYGAVTIRLVLPDGHVLQTAFPAAAPLSHLHALAARALAPGLPFHLFTTPPKTKLKDLGVSFFKAQLIPAAKVLVGLDCDPAPSSLLRPDVAALLGPPPTRHDALAKAKGRRQEPQQQQEQPAAARPEAAAGGGRAPGARVLPSGSAVPKWMKI